MRARSLLPMMLMSVSVILAISLFLSLSSLDIRNAYAASDLVDFNGDGYADLAVSRGDLAGGVDVIYGSSSGLRSTAIALGNGHASQFWNQDSPGIEGIKQGTDGFGVALAGNDFNKDGYADLAIGVSNDGAAGEGEVNVIYGTSDGLRASAVAAGNGHSDQLWTQTSLGINVNQMWEGEHFGSSLATGDFNKDGYADLAIGEPNAILGANGGTSRGAVSVIYGTSDGLRVKAIASDNGHAYQFWTQDSTGIEGVAEDHENFGWSLTAGDYNGDGSSDLAIGNTWESLETSGITEPGVVNVIYGSSNGLRASAVAAGNGHSDQLWRQGSGGIEGVAQDNDHFGFGVTTGDFNHDGRDDLAIGVPGDIAESGAVNVIYGSSDGLRATAIAAGNGRSDQIWTQNSSSIEGTTEVGDAFGFAVYVGFFNGDLYEDLAIGVPGEDFSGQTDAGGVNVIYGTSIGLSAGAVRDGTGKADQFWSQESTNVQDTAQSLDSFGRSLSSGDYDGDAHWDHAIGVPMEGGTDRGAVNVIYGSSDGLRATAIAAGNGRSDQIWLGTVDNSKWGAHMFSSSAGL